MAQFPTYLFAFPAPGTGILWQRPCAACQVRTGDGDSRPPPVLSGIVTLSLSPPADVRSKTLALSSELLEKVSLADVNNAEIVEGFVKMSCLRKVIYLLGVTACVHSKLDVPRTNLDIEEEVSLDTKICEDAAKLTHNGDPNASLDLFVTCLLKKLEKLPDNDNQEIAEVMSTLETVEHLSVEEHNIVKRQADEYHDGDHYSSGDMVDSRDIDFSVEILEEGRKWKDKKKKDKKQKKKNRRKWKEVVHEDVHEDIQEEDEAENVDGAIMEIGAPINEIPEIKTEENASEEKQGQGQVLQFSAYSGAASQPQYEARPKEQGININHNQIYEDEKEDGGRRKYLYSVDYQVCVILSGLTSITLNTSC